MRHDRDKHPLAQSAYGEAPPSPQWRPENPAYRSPALRVVDLAGEEPPPRPWIVPGWIPIGHTTLLYGDGGLGKSLLALQLAAARALRQRWLGLEVRPGRTLYVSFEDEADEIKRRLDDVARVFGAERQDLAEDVIPIDGTVEWESSLMRFHKFDDEPPAPTELFQRVHNAAQDHGTDLVVFDALHDAFDGDEIKRTHARRFIRLNSGLARDIDGAVIICAHPSREGMRDGSGTSGNTAWNNACRSRLFFRRPKDAEHDAEAADLRVLRRMKSNYSRSGDEITVRWRDGAFIREHEPTGAVLAIEHNRADRIFLTCLDELTSQQRAVSHSKNSPAYAPKMMAPLSQADGLKARDLADAMERLFSAGTITNGAPFQKANRHPATGIVRTKLSNGDAP